jgi:hypothetical protein
VGNPVDFMEGVGKVGYTGLACVHIYKNMSSPYPSTKVKLIGQSPRRPYGTP